MEFIGVGPLFGLLAVIHFLPFLLDPIVRRVRGYTKPYKWGYYAGLGGLLLAPIYLVDAWLTRDAFPPEERRALITPFLPEAIDLNWAILVVFATIPVFSLGILLRRKWGWYLFIFTLIVFAPTLMVFLYLSIIPATGELSFPPTSRNLLYGGLLTLNGWIAASSSRTYAKKRWRELR